MALSGWEVEWLSRMAADQRKREAEPQDPADDAHHRTRLLAMLEGERKARNLLLVGMESQAELMDGLKQENRRLRRVADAARALVQRWAKNDKAGILAPLREAVQALNGKDGA